MAIAYDAFSSATVGTGDLTWTHTPVGTPKGVIVYVILNGAYSDEVISVTYGATTMTEVTGSPLLHSSGELATVFCYFLGQGIASGAQTVTVDVNAGGSTKAAGCITLTATTDTYLQDVDSSIQNASLANPTATLQLGGNSSFCCIGFHSGIGNVSSISPNTGWTSRYEYDYGAQTCGIYTYNTVSTADVTAGWTQSADDATAIALAVREAAATIALKTAVLTGTADELEDVLAPARLVLDTASLTATGILIDVYAPSEETIALDTATLTATGTATQINQTVVLETAQLWFASSRNRQIDLDTAHLTATGIPLTLGVDQTISLDTAQLTTTGIHATIGPTGVVPIALDTVTLTATGIPVTLSAPISRTLDTATLTATGISVDVTGEVTIPLDSTSLTATSIALANVNAPLSIVLDAAVLTATGISATPKVQIYITLDTADLSLTGIIAYFGILTEARIRYTVQYQVILLTVPVQGGISTATALTVLPVKSKAKVYNYV